LIYLLVGWSFLRENTKTSHGLPSLLYASQYLLLWRYLSLFSIYCYYYCFDIKFPKSFLYFHFLESWIWLARDTQWNWYFGFCHSNLIKWFFKISLFRVTIAQVGTSQSIKDSVSHSKNIWTQFLHDSLVCFEWNHWLSNGFIWMHLTCVIFH
jgi:hypothetical protein